MKKRIILFFALLLIAVFALGGCVIEKDFIDAGAEYDLKVARTSSNAIDYGFRVEKVRTLINIDENGNAQISETLDVMFLQRRRGIIKDLPTNSGEHYKNIKVETKLVMWGTGSTRSDDIPTNYFVEFFNGFVSINTGTSDWQKSFYFEQGDIVNYTFSYKIIPPKKYNNYKNYYMNLLGTSYPTEVRDIEIKVNFPSSVQKIYLPHGPRGSSKAVEYRVDNDSFTLVSGQEDVISAQLQKNNSILIKANNLSAYYGITMQAAIQKPFKKVVDSRFVIILVASIIIAAIFILLKVINKRPEIIEVVNFRPPKVDGNELSPAEVGLLIDGSCTPEDITALIFYWASRGNLQIRGSEKEKEEKKGENITLVKLVELPPSAPEYEKKLFAQLFKNGNRVNIESLKNKFYMHISQAQSAVQKKYHGKLYGYNRTILLALLAVAISALGYFLYGLTISKKLFLWQGIFIVAPAAIVFSFEMARQRQIHKLTPTKRKLFFAFNILLALVAGSVFVLNKMLWPLVPLNIALMVGILLAPSFITIKEFYHNILGDLIGFKNFLLHAEKDKLEALLEENPQYYYDILPYANVLGVSDIWQNKFKDLSVQPPNYYYSPHNVVLNIIIFNHLYKNMFRNIRMTTVSRPSSAGKSGGFGGFGGGGFGGGISGGGFGGGGLRSR